MGRQHLLDLSLGAGEATSKPTQRRLPEVALDGQELARHERGSIAAEHLAGGPQRVLDLEGPVDEQPHPAASPPSRAHDRGARREVGDGDQLQDLAVQDTEHAQGVVAGRLVEREHFEVERVAFGLVAFGLVASVGRVAPLTAGVLTRQDPTHLDRRSGHVGQLRFIVAQTQGDRQGDGHPVQSGGCRLTSQVSLTRAEQPGQRKTPVQATSRANFELARARRGGLGFSASAASQGRQPHARATLGPAAQGELACQDPTQARPFAKEPPWLESTRSSSSGISGATPSFATCRTGARWLPSTSPPRAGGRTSRPTRWSKRPSGIASRCSASKPSTAATTCPRAAWSMSRVGSRPAATTTRTGSSATRPTSSARTSSSSAAAVKAAAVVEAAVVVELKLWWQEEAKGA